MLWTLPGGGLFPSKNTNMILVAGKLVKP